jgi:predicted GIY-YIG superfamily endonuclease
MTPPFKLVERKLALVAPFSDAITDLQDKLIQLLDCKPITFESKPRGLPMSVVYLFSDKGEAKYVGRSNNFRQRLGNHCNHGSKTNQSSVAFRMACASLDIKLTKYKKKDPKVEVLDQFEGLRSEFTSMKAMMRKMEIRYIVENDQVKQMLLEAYVALALELPHDFGTH